eukprot:g37230.t1
MRKKAHGIASLTWCQSPLLSTPFSVQINPSLAQAQSKIETRHIRQIPATGITHWDVIPIPTLTLIHWDLNPTLILILTLTHWDLNPILILILT